MNLFRPAKKSLGDIPTLQLDKVRLEEP